MDYQDKYIKYKTKYLELKNANINNQIGGGNLNFMKNLIKKANIPGLSISIIENGKTNNYIFGVSDNDTKKKINNYTIYISASLSKPVFSYCILKLVEQKILDLDKPLSEYVNLGKIDKIYIMDKRFNKITTRMILSHTSGLGNIGENKILFTPGTNFCYSGDGFILLQLIVEKITKKQINDIIIDNVFTPFNMEDSSFIYRNKYNKKIITQHDYNGNTKPYNFNPHTITNAHVAGGLFTTLNDYTKFLIGLSNDKSIINMMLEEQIKLNNNIFWGLGVPIEIINNKKMIWHWGDNFNFRHFFIYDPINLNGFVLFTNSYNGLSIIDKISEKIFNIKYKAVLELKKLTEGRYLHEQYNNPLRIERLLILDTFMISGTEKGIDKLKKWIDKLKIKDKQGQLNALVEDFKAIFQVWDNPQDNEFINAITKLYL